MDRLYIARKVSWLSGVSGRVRVVGRCMWRRQSNVIGVAKVTVCQPLMVSFVNVAVQAKVPVLAQSWPV